MRLDTIFRRNDDTRMEALMDLADWLRSLRLERYEAAHIEPVSRKSNGNTPDPVTEARFVSTFRADGCPANIATIR